MPPETSYIQAIGCATPPTAIASADAVELFAQACRSPRTAKLMRRVGRLTGIDQRYLAALGTQLDPAAAHLYQPCAQQPDGPGMGARNGRFAAESTPLVRSTLGAFSRDALAQVRTLVTVSCTHASSPGLERAAFAHAPLRRDVSRWNLGFMGCSAALAGVRLVHQARQTCGDALLIACELSSLHFQYSDDLDQLTANLIFADGAAATLLTSRPAPARVVDCACAALPEHADQMVWFADDHGLRLRLAQELPDTLRAHVRAAVEPLLGRNGLALEDVRHWLVHPGGPQVLDAVEQALALPDGALALSRDTLRNFGNMSSPTILFILRELLERRGEGHAVAIAFGPGLTIEIVLLELRQQRGA